MASKTPHDMLSEVLAQPAAIRATAMTLPKAALVHMLSHSVAYQFGKEIGCGADPWLVGILRGGFKGYEHMTVRELANVAADTYGFSSLNGDDLIAAYKGFLQAVESGKARSKTALEGRR